MVISQEEEAEAHEHEEKKATEAHFGSSFTKVFVPAGRSGPNSWPRSFHQD